MSSAKIYVGDVIDKLREMPAGSVQTCVTSPPYWGLRDYGQESQLGLETTPQEYVDNMVTVFREVWRVLADDGTVWLNIGDSYNPVGRNSTKAGLNERTLGKKFASDKQGASEGHVKQPFAPDVKAKELVGIPWRLAFALQDVGWYLRQDIIWAKPNPMPESVKDRCTKSHEYIFLLSKQNRYYFDSDAIKEPANPAYAKRYESGFGGSKNRLLYETKFGKTKPIGMRDFTGMRNKRDVWTIPTKPFKGAHFAVMPEALVEPCILSGSREGDTVLDPFTGSGTVAVVALRHGRNFVGTELNPEYAEIAVKRIGNNNLFNEIMVK